MHDRRQAVLGEERQFVGFEKTLEQENRLSISGLAQGDRVVEVKQRIAVGKVVERLGGAHQPVAIGIRLDDGPEAGLAGVLPGNGKISAQGGKVESGADRAGQVWRVRLQPCFEANCLSLRSANSTKVFTRRERNFSFG